MCGIAGLLSDSQYQDYLDTVIQRMQASLQHRGPDDQGIYISPDRKAAIAHTRLSILDLSSAGHQPMSTDNERYWITFNGEIYNFRELRDHLIAEGEQFKSQTDTEVILKLYQKMGSDCVKKLRGMFAFAIWDNFRQSCFLARDPLGIKPLYYWKSGATLLFASELRTILASKIPSFNLSPEGLYGYLMSGSVPEPYTLIEGIFCLEAGHWLHWESGNLRKQQYWQINFTSEPISQAEAVEKVRQALVDSVKAHFVSDVPVGVFLSGGIDSTAIVALASQTQSSQLRTYSIAFDEPELNEGEIAHSVARKFGTDHTEYKITASLGQTLLTQFLDAIDQPTIDGFNIFCVSKITRDKGTKVVLSGLGGDELFGGYGSFRKVPQLIRWGNRTQLLRYFNVGYGLEAWVKSTKLKRLGDFLQQPPNAISAYRSYRGIFTHREACAIASRYLPSDTLLKRPNSEQLPPFPSLEDEVSFLEMSRYMRNQLLRDSDVMSMAWGLEARVPLVDRVLIETISSIPSSIRLASGKQLLVQAVPEIPEWVVKRPKQPFLFPFERWSGKEWREFFDNIQCPKNIVLDAWYRRWSLAILQNWLNQLKNDGF